MERSGRGERPTLRYHGASKNQACQKGESREGGSQPPMLQMGASHAGSADNGYRLGDFCEELEDNAMH